MSALGYLGKGSCRPALPAALSPKPDPEIGNEHVVAGEHTGMLLRWPPAMGIAPLSPQAMILQSE